LPEVESKIVVIPALLLIITTCLVDFVRLKRSENRNV